MFYVLYGLGSFFKEIDKDTNVIFVFSILSAISPPTRTRQTTHASQLSLLTTARDHLIAYYADNHFSVHMVYVLSAMCKYDSFNFIQSKSQRY